MKLLFFTLFLCLQFSYCLGQKTYTTKTFIQHAFDNILPELSTEPNARQGWISAIELRSETDEFLLANQEYQLRVTPTSLGQRRNRRAYLELLYQKTQLQQLKEQQVFLSLIYKDWVDLYQHQQSINLNIMLDSVLTDQLIVSKNLLDSENYNYQKIFLKEKEQQLLQLKIKEEIISIQTILKSYELEENQLSFDDIVSIKNLANRIDFLMKKTDGYIMRENQIDIDILKKEMDLEKSDRRNLLDFFQFEYRGPHELGLDQKIAVGIGIRMPIADNSKMKIKELLLEKEEEDYKKQLDSINMIRSIAKLETQLQREIAFYDVYETLENNLADISQNLESYLSNGDLEKSFEILKIKEEIIKTKLEKASKKAQILYAYIDFLFLKSLLKSEDAKYFLNASILD